MPEWISRYHIVNIIHFPQRCASRYTVSLQLSPGEVSSVKCIMALVSAAIAVAKPTSHQRFQARKLDAHRFADTLP